MLNKVKFVFYTNSVSAHQLPLARELVARLGADNYQYVYTGSLLQGGGQEVVSPEPWIVQEWVDGRMSKAELRIDKNSTVQSKELLETCDILMVGGLRPIELIERRAEKGLKTFYCTELWFKPLELGVGGRCWCRLPGRVRMLVLRYRRMAKQFVNWLKNDPHARCFVIGPWAKKDMLWLGVPESKIVDWGYFVEKGLGVRNERLGVRRNIRVLWVGRMLDWKRVDTIVRAVALANMKLEKEVGVGDLRKDFEKKVEKIGGEEKGVRGQELGVRFQLTLVGDGPEKERLLKLAERLDAKNKKETETPLSTSSSFLHLLPPVPIAEVRTLMREHDIYVLASNAEEGWGAALNEAMEEGMTCFGTYEAGASAALLPRSNLFHAGDWRALADLLVAFAEEKIEHPLSTSTSFLHLLPHAYTPAGAADKLMELIK